MEKPGKCQWRDAAGAKHVNRFRVVAEQQCAAFPRPPPKALFAEGHLPVLDVYANVGFLQPVLINSRNRLRGLNRIGIHESDSLAPGKRVRGAPRRMLILPANVKRVFALARVPGQACRVVKSFLKRAPEIVDHRLARLRAVRQWLPADIDSAGVY